MKGFLHLTVLGFLFLVLSGMRFAGHDGLLHRIRQKTEEIRKHPTDPVLYFERGYLYQLHENYDAALEDYTKAAALGLEDPLLEFRKAQVFYTQHHYEAALRCLSYYRSRAPKDILPDLIEGRIYRDMGAFDRAIPMVHHFIQNVEDLSPENILEYARIFLLKDSTDWLSAASALDEGMNLLGVRPVVLLQQQIKYYKAAKAYPCVEQCYNECLLSGYRKEYWHYEKAKFLQQTGQKQKAFIALQQAKMEWAQLPDNIKIRPAMQRLKSNISTLEKQLQ